MLGRARQVVTTIIAAGAALLLFTGTARAIPEFAAQTGQPCTACHIGAFGPQLTPAGIAFKIGGYTQGGGEGLASKIPLSAMFLGSFTNTNSSLPFPASEHYGANNNVALDQISLFLAGRVNDYAGGLVQGTFSGITSQFHLDNTDLRPFTTTVHLGDKDLRVGVSINNSPTVQDPFNSTFAWGYPYMVSALAPVPSAQPVLAGALAGNTYGVTAYGWYDRSLYLEAGGYETMGPTMLSMLGTTYGPGSATGLAPYLRAAYDWQWGGQYAYVGGLFFRPRFNPTIAPRSTDGSMGHDGYTDFAVDGGYEFLGTGKHVVSAYGIYTYESQRLLGSFNTGASSSPSSSLQQIRLNTSYFYDQTYGLTLGWQNTWGPANPALYAPAPVFGSANGKPNSNSFIVEADWIPFGKMDSWLQPFVNLKIGLQYVAYTQFNGGTSNYDGFGRNASGNNTLYLYAMTIF